jgi:hypothetical protein
LCACAAQPPTAAGKHLVYRDSGGTPTLQVDYPSADFCRKVEAIASRNARCQSESAANQLHARATLRYDPPGMLVEGHYPDVARCQSANSKMAPGVELVNPCSATADSDWQRALRLAIASTFRQKSADG